MIIIPVWVLSENSTDICVIFGSDPKANSEPEWISRKNIDKLAYSDLTSGACGKRMAVLAMKEEKLPEKLKKFLENMS